MKSMWIAITALAGVLLIGVASVAGTVTYTNDTNAVATGLEVEFSTPATITWHSGQFAKQDPSGFAAKFTFSDGSVNPGDTFMISWGPDAVKVVDHTWVTAEGEAAASGTLLPGSNSSADDSSGNTTTAPAPEQMKPAQPWTLTDEYGNTDIMDDDDIVLHLGVPASQVEKIVWKRNGITMRFIDPKDNVTVLTNDLMKTFDGNYREHSPASSHTDHAIAGYDYSAVVYLADGNLKAFKTTIESTFRWRPKEVWAEMDNNWTSLFTQLNYDGLVNFFKKLKQDGFTGIGFDITYYMNSPYDNKISELKSVNSEILPADLRTPSLNELETMLAAINEAGLQADVRGYIWISQEYIDRFGFTYSALIEPTNPTAFFNNYTQYWLKLVPLLNKHNVKLITPFIEMTCIEKYPDLIKRMYATISEQFEGEMGFEEETHNIFMGHYTPNPITTVDAYAKFERAFTFWNWEDSQGRPLWKEYSNWVIPLESQEDQRVSVMVGNFIKFWHPAVDYSRSHYPKDPQMFGELGVYDADGVCLGESYYNIVNKVIDDQEVADIWYSYFKGSKTLGINSLVVWSIHLGDLWENRVGNGFLNIGLRQPESPAYRVITAIIKPEGD